MNLLLSTAILLIGSCICISEINYNETYYALVDPLFSSGETKQFNGKDNVQINYWMRLSPNHSPSSPSRALVISPGRDVPLRNYAELFYDLNSAPHNLNLSFYILDHRGQGDSGLVDSKRDHYQVSDVLHFDDYVFDFAKFYTNVVADNDHSMYFVLGDSMGGLIASLYMERNPKSFQAAILSSPMFGIQSGYPDWVARIFTASVAWLGLGPKPVFGEKRSTAGLLSTSSSARYYLGQKIAAKQKDLGVSNRWVSEVLKTCSSFSSSKATIPVPSLMLQAGMEMIVDPKQEEAVCKRSLNCAHKVFDQAYHEILFERDEIRNKAIDTMASFIDNVV